MFEESTEAEPPKAIQDHESKPTDRNQAALESGTETIFSTSKPRHAMDGLSKGAGNILKGALAGAGMVVSAPLQGAYEGSKDGKGTWGAIKGFGFGLGIGLVGGTALAVGGVVTGAAQIGRGIYHTPGAMSAMSAGQEWDEDTKSWILYDLKKEADAILNMSEEDFIASLVANYEKSVTDAGGVHTPSSAQSPHTQSAAPTRIVKELEFYDVLGVPASATSAEIKKAYYVKAKANHPDRHRDDPEAHAKFQKIGEAYQVLSDEKLRANYDHGGKEGVEGAPKMDSGALFAMIFGSEKFEPLVGELQLASQMQAETEYQGHPRVKKFKQKKREVKCAVNLAAKLQQFIDMNCDEASYRELMRVEAKELSGTAFGGTLVATIGTEYSEYARQEADTLDGIGIGLRQTQRGIVSRYSIASSGVKAALSANAVNKMQQKLKADGSIDGSASPPTDTTGAAAGGAGGAESGARDDIAAGVVAGKISAEDAVLLKQKIQEMSSHMFEVMWYISEMDIRATLASVCHKVIHDHSVAAPVLTQRLQALKILGEVFLECGNTAEAGFSDLMTRVGGQMQQQQGQQQQEQQQQQQQQQHEQAEQAKKRQQQQQQQQSSSSARGKQGSDLD